MDWYWWVVLAFALIAIETLTLDLVLFMFSGGAVAAAITSAAGYDIVGQTVAFALTSLVLVSALRPYLLKNLRKRSQLTETNAPALVGKEAVVLQTVSPGAGLVKLSGEVWTARTVAGELPPGTVVTVSKIDGATAVVAPKTESKI